MEPLNWTQEHKSVWDGPASKATGHAPGPRAIGPCRCRTTGQRACELANSNRRPLRRPACVTRRDFLEVGNFTPFSEFLHIKGRNFPDVFYPFTSTYDPYERWKVSWKSVRTFLRNSGDKQTDRQTDRHTHTQMRQLYVYNMQVTLWCFRYSEVNLSSTSMKCATSTLKTNVRHSETYKINRVAQNNKPLLFIDELC